MQLPATKTLVSEFGKVSMNLQNHNQSTHIAVQYTKLTYQ